LGKADEGRMTNDEDAPFRPWSFVLRHSRFTIQIGWL
jgi:hypothetical protein